MGKATENSPRRELGLLLGGVGAGTIEFGRDGRLRQITINNNRQRHEAIPISPYSFMAVQVRRNDEVYQRILQVKPRTDTATGALRGAYMKRGTLAWQGTYPVVSYVVADANCPAEVVWSVLSPIIPYDPEAAALPLVCLSVRFRNPGDAPVEAAAAFNWENLSGAMGDGCPEYPPPIRFGAVSYEDKSEAVIATERKRGIGRKQPEAPLPLPAAPESTRNAIFFGPDDEATASNAHGTHVLAARKPEGGHVSMIAWDPANAEGCEALWRHLAEYGTLHGFAAQAPSHRAGMLCASAPLGPWESRRLDFVLAWHCPRFEVAGRDQGNVYTIRHTDAASVAGTGLRHFEYFAASVGNWQKRIQQATLPAWLNAMLQNNTHTLANNAYYTRDNAFGLRRGPDAEETGTSGERLYASFGTLLFFPGLEEAEMIQLGHAARQHGGRLPRCLGRGNLHTPEFGEGLSEELLASSVFALCAYRNYLLTGNLPRAQSLYPAARECMQRIRSLAGEGNALPMPGETFHTYDGIEVSGACSYHSGLWIAALRGMAHYARLMRLAEDAAHFFALSEAAAARFEEAFWDEAGGYYRLFHDPTLSHAAPSETAAACHIGQLAGQWYADFLGLGDLFDRGRVRRALETISQYNQRSNGVASTMMPNGGRCPNPAGTSRAAEGHHAWPIHTATEFACLQIYRGQTERGLHALEQIYRNPHIRSAQPFALPSQWDLAKNQAAAGNLEGSSGALAIWHVLYALQGLLFNVPEAQLRLMPNLPPGIHTLNAPIFTPACLGQLSWKEEHAPAYRQRAHITFDSPVSLQSIVLRVPSQGPFEISVEAPGGPLAHRVAIVAAGNQYRLHLTAARPITVHGTLSVAVRASG